MFKKKNPRCALCSYCGCRGSCGWAGRAAKWAAKRCWWTAAWRRWSSRSDRRAASWPTCSTWTTTSAQSPRPPTATTTATRAGTEREPIPPPWPTSRRRLRTTMRRLRIAKGTAPTSCLPTCSRRTLAADRKDSQSTRKSLLPPPAYRSVSILFKEQLIAV